MTDSCPAIERLVEIAELPPGDPRRRHLEDCPRCQARLADYGDFMAGAAEVPAEHFDDAMAHLERALAEEIHPDVKPFRPAPGRPFLNRPAVRGALALAAVLLLAISLNGLWTRPDPPDIRLRAPEGAGPGRTFEPGSARRLPGGDLSLSWQSYPGAEDYVVRILGADLSPRAELPAGADTSLRLAATRLRELLGDETLFAWQVLARSGGDTLARTAVVAQELAAAPAP